MTKARADPGNAIEIESFRADVPFADSRPSPGRKPELAVTVRPTRPWAMFEAFRRSSNVDVERPTLASAFFVEMGGALRLSICHGTLLAFTVAICPVLAQTCPPTPLQALLSPQPFTDGEFGYAVAATDSVVVVGCPVGAGPSPATGLAIVMDPGFLSLGPQIALHVPGATAGDRVGHAVAVDGDVIVLGAPNTTVNGLANAGAVHVFERVTGAWKYVSTLVDPSTAAASYFGRAVHVSGSRLVIGAPGDGTQTSPHVGRAVIFERDTQGAWVYTATLNPAGGIAGQFFGASVACDGATVIVGSPIVRRFYVYDLFAGLWFQTASVLDGNPDFGRKIAFRSPWLVSTADPGPHVYKRVGASWAFTGELATPFGIARDSIALSSNRIVAGGVDASGFVAAWELHAESWVPIGGTLWGFPPDVPIGFNPVLIGFGSSAAIAGNRIVVGAPTTKIENGPTAQHRCGAAYYVRMGKGTIQSFGVSCSGSGGFSPTLNISGCAISSGLLTLEVSGGVGGSVALLLFGPAAANSPIGFGCSLAVAPILPATPLIPLFGAGDGQGAIAISGSLPVLSFPAMFTVQAICADPGAPLGFTSTNGIATQVQ